MPTDQGPTRGCPGALQLAPGMEAYVQVQAVPNWERGSAGDGSFAVLPMSAAEARSYLPTMTNLGQRDPVHCINEAE